MAHGLLGIIPTSQIRVCKMSVLQTMVKMRKAVFGMQDNTVRLHCLRCVSSNRISKVRSTSIA